MLLAVFLLVCPIFAGQADQALPGTSLLDWQGDLAARNVDGIHQFLDRALAASVEKRQRHWNRDFTTAAAYSNSIEKNRNRLRKIAGVIEARLAPSLQTFADAPDTDLVAEADTFTVRQVRWQALEGIWGEGLLLEPRTAARASVVALPDADQSPEQLSGLAPGVAPESQFARILAANGCRVLVPLLVSRSSDFSGNPDLASTRTRVVNMPHREWLHRMSYEMGRHLIGYEVQKVLSAVDWFKATADKPVGVAGYGEGGLVAFYAAAMDPRIDAALVSGYFQPRETMWQQPIYRNIWSLLDEFGDAEIASLVFPRSLIIENSSMPQVEIPPTSAPGRGIVRQAAPGRIVDPKVEDVIREFGRARDIWNRLPSNERGQLRLVPANGRLSAGLFGSEEAIRPFLTDLHPTGFKTVAIPTQRLQDSRQKLDLKQRQLRQIRQIEAHAQYLLRISEQIRDEAFLNKMPKKAEDFVRQAVEYRKQFHEEVIGKVTEPMLPPKARTRQVYDREKWRGCDVVLDVWPDVFAWGILLVPKDLKPGERRPVVVTQHGLEGLPKDVIEEATGARDPYHAFAARLADMGFIVFAPFNPYRGYDRFRQLQFKANPLKLSLFSFIIGQHQQLVGWLKSLPFVDGSRIGFYGLSYGGKTAMRIPAVVEDYALSICSGDFNEWIWKNVNVTWPNSYMFMGEYEMYEFDLGLTFNYAEMAYLIFPRPFMVERGHRDGVGLDEWVSYEYAKVRRLYDELGVGDRTQIEYFNGVHEIHGKGTFDFLRKHLGWKRE